MIEPQVVS